MVNPRQRRKQKNPQLKKRRKATSQSTRKYSVTGHDLIAKNWDKKLTLRQNYARLGLMASLNPTTGGSEKRYPSIREQTEQGEISSLINTASTNSLPRSSNYMAKPPTPAHLKRLAAALPRTQGIIQRDEQGRVINVILGGLKTESMGDDLEEEQDEQDDMSVDEEDLIDLDPDELRDLLDDKQEGDLEQSDVKENDSDDEVIQQIENTNPIIAQLEKEASVAKSKTSIQPRLASNNELDWCGQMVEKYGNDDDDDTYGRMFRDKRLNVWQLSVGDIRRRIRRWRKQQ